MASKVNIVINGKNLASKAIKEVTHDLKETDGITRKLSASMMGMLKFGLGSAIAAAGVGIAAATVSIRKSADFSDVRMQFETLLGSYTAAKDMLDELQTLSAKTPLQLYAVTEAATQLLAVGTDKGAISDELRMLGDLAMGNEAKFKTLTDGYAKMRAKGKVSMKELNRFTENGVPLLGELAENLGVTNAELMKMVSGGKIGLNDVQDAMKALTEEGGMFFGMMEKKSQGINGKISTLGDNLSMTAIKWGDAFEPLAGSILDNAIKKLEDFSDSEKFNNFVETTVRWASWASEAIPKIGLVIGFIGEVIAITVRHAGEELDKITNKVIELPIIKAVIEFAGNAYEAIKKGFATGDWSDAFDVGVTIFKTGIAIWATVKLAEIVGGALLSSISSSLIASGFLAVGKGVSLPGVVAAVTIVVQLLEAMETGEYERIGKDMAVGIAAGLGIAAFTKSPRAGLLAFDIVANLGFGEILDGPISDIKGWFADPQTLADSLHGIFREVWQMSGIYAWWTTGGDKAGLAFMDGVKSFFKLFDLVGALMDLWNLYTKPMIDSMLENGKNIGENLVQGFKNGIDNMWDSAIGKVKSFFTDVLGWSRKTLDERSPSKETEEMGKFFVEGFLVGVDNPSFRQEIIASWQSLLEALKNVGKTESSGIIDNIFGGTSAAKVASKGKGLWASFFEGIQSSYNDSGLKPMMDSLGNLGNVLFDNTLNFLDSMKEKIANSKVGQFFGKMGSNIGNFFSNVGEKLSQTGVGKKGSEIGAAIAPILGSFGSGLSGMISTLSSFKALMSPMLTILSGVMDVLGPLIDKALAPLLGILTIFGRLIGGILAPAFDLLAEVTEIVGKAFVWIYNKILLPIGNGLISIFNIFYNAVAGIINGIGKALYWLGVRMSMDYRSMDAGHMQSIDYAALTGSASSYTGSGSGTGGSTSSVQNVTIYNYQTVEGNVIGDGGMAQLGEFFVRAVEQYIGNGGTVAFVQGA